MIGLIFVLLIAGFILWYFQRKDPVSRTGSVREGWRENIQPISVGSSVESSAEPDNEAGIVLGNRTGQDIASQQRSEIIWKVIFGEFRSSRADAYLNKYRQIFSVLAEGKTLEEKHELLSSIEFDRVGGRTILRKQSHAEKSETIALLELEFLPPCSVLTNLRKAFDPRVPYFRLLSGEVHFATEQWQVAQMETLIQKGCAYGGESLPLAELLKHLSVSELSKICVEHKLPTGKRKRPMIDVIVGVDLKFDVLKSYFKFPPFAYAYPAASEIDRVTDYWRICGCYVDLCSAFEFSA